MSVKADHVIKLRSSGDATVGKTCLMLRWFEDSFSSAGQVTIGADTRMKVVDMGNKKVSVQMLDSGGQEKFRSITSSYYRGAHGVLLVYDITNRASFDNIRTWASEAQRYMTPEGVRVLVGNKADLADKRAVSAEEGQQLATDMNFSHFLETSCKEGLNVHEIFNHLIESIYEKMETKPGYSSGPMQDTLSMDGGEKKKKKGCYLY